MGQRHLKLVSDQKFPESDAELTPTPISQVIKVHRVTDPSDPDYEFTGVFEYLDYLLTNDLISERGYLALKSAVQSLINCYGALDPESITAVRQKFDASGKEIKSSSDQLENEWNKSVQFENEWNLSVARKNPFLRFPHEEAFALFTRDNHIKDASKERKIPRIPEDLFKARHIFLLIMEMYHHMITNKKS